MMKAALATSMALAFVLGATPVLAQSIKIPQLPAAGALTGSELLIVDQNGSTRQTTLGAADAYVNAHLPAIGADLVRDCGGKDDGTAGAATGTDNLVALTACLARLSGGGTLTLNRSAGGSGLFRTSANPVVPLNVSIRKDSNATGLLNVDGSPSTMGYSIGGQVGGIAANEPVGADYGGRVSAPGYDEMFMAPGYANVLEQEYIKFDGNQGSPYVGFAGRRSYALIGQNKPTSTSLSFDFLNANVYPPAFDANGNQTSGVSNGPGNNFNCTATNGSNVLTNCTLASDATKNPASINPATGSAYLFFPTRVYGGTIAAPGVPLKAADSTSMTMTTPGTFDDQNVPYNYAGCGAGTAGLACPVVITAVAGISEINLLSHHEYALGSTPGLAYYNEINTNCSKGTTDASDNSYCNALLVDASKNSPGLSHDIFHHGSVVFAAQAEGTPYTFDAVASITAFGSGGYGGADPAATVGAVEGLSIGGGGPLGTTPGATQSGCMSPYCNYDYRSWFHTSLHLSDYDGQAILIDNPMLAHSSFSGNAVVVAPKAGNVSIGDNLIVGTNLLLSGLGISANPLTSPVAWDFDKSTAPVTIAAGATFALPRASGFIVVNDYTTGSVAALLAGGNSVFLLGQTMADFATAAAANKISLAYQSSTASYAITNGTSAPVSLGIFAASTRNVQ